MRTSTLLLSMFLAGCVWDRTGQSATETWRREMAIQSTRTQTLQAAVEDALVRVEQLEEVTRARGQDEIMRMETLDQLRNEVARLRGDLEVLQHEAGLSTESSGKFREDAEFRLAWLESRAQALEESLGMEPPEPPVLAELDDTGLDGEPEGPEDAGDGSQAGDGGQDAADEPAGPMSDEERIALADEHMKAGRHLPARAIYQKLLESVQDDAQLSELRYLLAETWFLEGQFQSAILAYQDVVDHHGTSDRAPWAMLRQGECFEALGQRDNAMLFYDDVIRLFPRSKAAKEAKALKAR
jgi:TolA-binding protein